MTLKEELKALRKELKEMKRGTKAGKKDLLAEIEILSNMLHWTED